MKVSFGPRRSEVVDITEVLNNYPLDASEKELFEKYDTIYRAVVAMLYNFVTCSGHPGGSISSGRFVSSLIFNTMNYDFSDPDRSDADIISYAAGHKALGLYAMWALRNEVVKAANPSLLPKNEKYQFRLEDLLGFRRNPINDTPLFKKFNSKHLDGHPTPATPFVKLSTGASGVGITTSAGLALGAIDYYDKAPYVHVVEGEGGMTPGRVYEMLACLGTSNIKNFILHLDWNQASIDSDKVCREGSTPGDYVQWDPIELLYLNDFNVVYVPDGKDYHQVIAAQKRALEFKNDQPTAIVYKTIKGWKYGIEGRKSHGAGHKFCSEEYFSTLKEFEGMFNVNIPCFTNLNSPAEIEEAYWKSLEFVRTAIENSDIAKPLADKILSAKANLDKIGRKPRDGAPNIDEVYKNADPSKVPSELLLEEGSQTTLRAQLGNTLNYLNKKSNGAIFASSADLAGSTSIANVAKGFGEGFFNSTSNAGSRLVAVGGICEDAITGMMAGVSTYGKHIGAGSSYGAFIAALGHISSRLHAIGNQAKQELNPNEPYKPYFLICAHAGVKTGEDGPTHADPQPLQLLEENFPKNTLVTLTPWDPQEVWYLVSAALKLRPAVIAPFVTRPNETIAKRKELNLAPASNSVTGVYALRKHNDAKGAVVLQGSEVANDFIDTALPKFDADNTKLNVYYVSSAELFDALPLAEQEKIFPIADRQRALGITGFTMPTLYKWILSEKGRAASLYPFKQGHYLGSGRAEDVLKQAKCDGLSQYEAIKRHIEE